MNCCSGKFFFFQLNFDFWVNLNSIEAADVVIMDDKPERLIDAIKISRSTMEVVWQNVVLSLGIKVAIMVLGTLGVTGMWLAVFGDVGVTFFAVLNAMRILRK